MLKYAFAGALLFASITISAQCGSCNQGASGAVWEGDVDSDWEDPNNWSGNTLPTGGAITINGGSYTNAPIITINSSFSPTDVFLENGASLTLQANLTLTDDFIIRDNSTLFIQGGSNASGDDINLCAGGTINMSGGTLDNTSGSGILRVCTSTPAGATGNTEIIISGGTLTSTTSDTESGVIDDFVTVTGSGLYTDNTVTLPVELVSFDGKPEGNRTILEWITASELNNDYFLVEKSLDGVNFTSIGQVAGNGTTNETKNYYFTDINPWKTTYYRLLQVDYDGRSEYHYVIRVENSSGLATYNLSYTHDRVQPLVITSLQAIDDLKLINSSGQIIYESQLNRSSTILTNDKTPGLYFLTLRWGNERVVERILLVK